MLPRIADARSLASSEPPLEHGAALQLSTDDPDRSASVDRILSSASELLDLKHSRAKLAGCARPLREKLVAARPFLPPVSSFRARSDKRSAQRDLRSTLDQDCR